jgi:cob(I)alamin adenosyltransferase
MGISITTKRGDAGQTDLLFGGRVGKAHPRLHAVGEVDELNAALGLVRVHVQESSVQAMIRRAQGDLVALMGILSAGPENAERYAGQGFQGLGAEAVDRLTKESAALEAQFPEGFKGWSMPGDAGGTGAAWLEMARCICRRAERAVAALPAADIPPNPHLIPWLNRLSDLLWLAARVEEKHHRAQG